MVGCCSKGYEQKARANKRNFPPRSKAELHVMNGLDYRYMPELTKGDLIATSFVTILVAIFEMWIILEATPNES